MVSAPHLWGRCRTCGVSLASLVVFSRRTSASTVVSADSAISPVVTLWRRREASQLSQRISDLGVCLPDCACVHCFGCSARTASYFPTDVPHAHWFLLKEDMGVVHTSASELVFQSHPLQ
mmetsp:Transcript_9898/g.21756  ORF Transcript_9898/g.21756 Transcript_9898/m.21756 type:complete len:120 (+) Transcript_9898:438-797(+)